MRTYRINCLDDEDRVVATHRVFCGDDLAALDRATALCANYGVEVWDGERRVVWMLKGGAARLERPNETVRGMSSLGGFATELLNERQQAAAD
jgi:hypothetical protein